jgi:hypothetical protein
MKLWSYSNLASIVYIQWIWFFWLDCEIFYSLLCFPLLDVFSFYLMHDFDYRWLFLLRRLAADDDFSRLFGFRDGGICVFC